MDDTVRRRTVIGAALGALAVPALGACVEGTDPSRRSARTQPPPGTAPSPTAASPTAPSPTAASPTAPSPSPAPTTPAEPADVAARATVPVLCWHQLRDWEHADSEYARTLLICPPAHFRAQVDALAEHGWTTIGPDTYLTHLMTGAALPDKPVLLTFDDSQGSQMSVAYPHLRRRRMTATFFVMTVVLDKPDWLSRRDVAALDDNGMTIGAHTWDHHRVDRYSGTDWAVQLERPKALLEKIVGSPVVHLAYPYGAWNQTALTHVAAAGYRSAYQLMDRPLDAVAPELTLRRLMVPSTWTGPRLVRHLEQATGHRGARAAGERTRPHYDRGTPSA